MMHRLFLAAFLSVFLIGCSTRTPPVTEYTLMPKQISHSSVTIPMNAPNLLILGTKSSPSLGSKSLLYLKDNHETGSYLYSRWSDSPCTMIDRFITKNIEESALFSNVLSKTSVVQSDFALESTLNAFYHRIHDNRSDVHLDITYVLIDQKNKKSVGYKRFLFTIPSKTNDAKGAVNGFNEALNELSIQCTDWLYTTLKETAWTK